MALDDTKQETAEGSSLYQHVHKLLLRLLEHNDILRRASTGGSDHEAGPNNRPIASLKWMETHCGDVLEALPFAVYATDAVGRITFYNEAAVALWGRRPVLGHDRWCGS